MSQVSLILPPVPLVPDYPCCAAGSVTPRLLSNSELHHITFDEAGRAFPAKQEHELEHKHWTISLTHFENGSPLLP